LRRAAERTASNLEAWLSSEVRGRLARFGLAKDFAPDESDAVTRFVLRLRDEPEDGEAAVELPLGAALVRSKLRSPKESVVRPLTEVEMAILEAEATTLVATISEAVEPLLGTPLALGGRQREAWDGPKESALLWARFEFTWDGSTGHLWIGLPAKACRARVEGTAIAAKLEPPALAARWTSLLEPVRVPVAVRLGETAVSVHDLVGLQVGDVILLEGAITDPVELTSGGHFVHAGRLGQHRGRWTFRVERGSAPPSAATGKP
jgi:flagellar motor switch protein FliM